MRAFVHLRQMLESHVELAKKIDALVKRYDAVASSKFIASEMIQPRSPKASLKRSGSSVNLLSDHMRCCRNEPQVDAIL